jgi:hypothetical protein
MDNEELKGENARLKAENEKYRRCFQAEGDWVLMEPGEHAMLTHKVKRLTKAGDEMAKDLLKEFGRKEMLKYKPYQNWKAAKEGKQSDG